MQVTHISKPEMLELLRRIERTGSIASAMAGTSRRAKARDLLTLQAIQAIVEVYYPDSANTIISRK